MAEAIYTEEDLEQYIEYSHRLYKKILAVFMPANPMVEKVSTDPMDKYAESMKEMFQESLGTMAFVQDVFRQIHEPFSMWLCHDCPLTGHKGREPSIITSLGSFTIGGGAQSDETG